MKVYKISREREKTFSIKCQHKDPITIRPITHMFNIHKSNNLPIQLINFMTRYKSSHHWDQYIIQVNYFRVALTYIVKFFSSWYWVSFSTLICRTCNPSHRIKLVTQIQIDFHLRLLVFFLYLTLENFQVIKSFFN